MSISTKHAVVDPQRSRTMAAVRSTDTGPEMIVRRLLHGLGYRFRLHRADLPGKPDLVFPGRRAVIFVHGCFWHGHDCTRGARAPRNNAAYWRAKIDRNKRRDHAAVEKLTATGWQVRVVWECELRDQSKLTDELSHFLGGVRV